MGDGREDDGRLVDVLLQNSRRHVAFDMNDEARAARTVISAVMFGAVAGSGLLPFDRKHCEAAITASGKGVDASLDGFERGFARAQGRAGCRDRAAGRGDGCERPTCPRGQADVQRDGLVTVSRVSSIIRTVATQNFTKNACAACSRARTASIRRTRTGTR